MKISSRWYLLPPAVLALFVLSCGGHPLRVVDLRCEYVVDPLGITVDSPRLSWRLETSRNGALQTAYRILVASSLERLNSGEGNLWDSGQVPSSETGQIVYEGRPLGSLQRAYWKVRVWDEKGRSSSWSETAWWETGLRVEDWQAHWIGAEYTGDFSGTDRVPAVYLRKSFPLAQVPERARICISGLGYYELYVNGQRVGDHVLAPDQTNYDWRNPTGFPDSRVDNMGTRVLYETFDVTPFLRVGQNVLGVCLGNGWYFLHGTPERAALAYGRPRLLAQLNLEFPDGTSQVIVSDSSWKIATGPILDNGVYTGEVYDARLEMRGWAEPGFDDYSWRSAAEMRPPMGKLVGQIGPPDRVVRTLEPVAVTKIGPKSYRFDLGEMMAGWAQLRVRGPEGAPLHLRFVEDSKADYGQHDTYVLRGSGQEIWEPRFTWHAFRYVDVLDAPFPLSAGNVVGRVVHTDVASAGTFECSNKLFNRILENYRRTQLQNMHGGVPSDCPHRERRGYTGDGQISALAALYNFDMAAFYTKWVADIVDAQNHRTGYVPNTAPYQAGSGGTAWGSAIVLIPWNMYLFYGDDRVLAENYPAMRKWIDYLVRQRDAEGLIVERDLGEWVPPEPTAVPPSLVSSAYYYHDLILMAKIARILGKEQDAVRFDTLAAHVRRAFHRRYFDADRNTYSIGRQGANVFALGFDLVPDSLRLTVFQSLVQHLQNDTRGHFDTGMMGTPLLLEVLTRQGRPDLAYTLMNQRDFPSFGYEINHGATTIWETWAGDASHSHPMFGGACAWFYYGLAGIQPDERQPGFRHVVFRPQPVKGMQFVSASYNSVRGRIQSRWRLRGDTFMLHVLVPPNATASVFVPAKGGGTVSVRGEPARFVGVSNSVAHYEIGSGRYTFVSSGIGELLRAPRLPAPQIAPAETLAFAPDPVVVRIHSDVPNAVIRYTLDGSEPERRARMYKGPIRISKRTEIRARLFRKGEPPGFVAKASIDFADSTLNGVEVAYFEGAWQSLPDFRSLHPQAKWHVYRLALDEIYPKAEKFGLVYSGQIAVPDTGLFEFGLVSNDGARLYIDGDLVVDNDGLHGAQEKTGQVRLTAGRHSVRVTYFQAGGGMLLKVYWQGPGVPRQPVPASALFLP